MIENVAEIIIFTRFDNFIITLIFGQEHRDMTTSCPAITLDQRIRESDRSLTSSKKAIAGYSAIDVLELENLIKFPD